MVFLKLARRNGTPIHIHMSNVASFKRSDGGMCTVITYIGSPTTTDEVSDTPSEIMDLLAKHQLQTGAAK